MTAGDPQLRDLHQRLRQSWSHDTSSHWRPDRPADGQCAVTALVVQDRLGGDLLKTDVAGAWHFYNRIAGGRVDFTAEQFDSPIGYDDLPSSRDDAFGDCTAEQYAALRERMTTSA